MGDVAWWARIATYHIEGLSDGEGHSWPGIQEMQTAEPRALYSPLAHAV